MTTQLSIEHARELHRKMVFLRRFEEKAAELYTEQKIRGFLHLYIGEEAVAVGATSAPADDDIHYTLLGMLVLEEHGPGFTHDDLYRLWATNLPHLWTWGPERSTLLAVGLNSHHLMPPRPVAECHDVLLLNPGDEMCGALIRADAYGYACPGHPDLAAWLEALALEPTALQS